MIKKLLKNPSMLTLMDQVVFSGGNFAMGLLLARTLGLEGFGRYTFAWMAVLIFTSLNKALIILPLISLGPARKDFNRFCGRLLVLQLAFVSVATLLAFLTGAFFPLGAPADFSLGLPLAVATISFLMQDYLRKQLFASNRVKFALLIDCVAQGGQLAAMAFFAWQGKLTTHTALIINGSAFGLSSLIGLFMHPVISKNYLAIYVEMLRLWKHARWLAGQAILQWVSGQWYNVLAGMLLGPAALGSLRLAQQVLGLLTVFYQAVENRVPVRASELFATDGINRMLNYLRDLAVKGGALNLLVLLLLFLFREPLFQLLYGTAGIESAWVMAALLPAYMLVFPGMPPRYALRTLDMTQWIFIAYFLAAVVSLSISAPLIKTWGLKGAAVGLAINQLVLCIGLWFPLNQKTKESCA